MSHVEEHAEGKPIVGWPRFLKGWLAVQVAGVVIGSILDPEGGIMWAPLIGWALITAALTYWMSIHAKAGWVFALIFAGLSIVGGLGLFGLSGPTVETQVWYIWGLVLGILELALLLLPEARHWFRQPMQRRGDP